MSSAGKGHIHRHIHTHGAVYAQNVRCPVHPFLARLCACLSLEVTISIPCAGALKYLCTCACVCVCVLQGATPQGAYRGHAAVTQTVRGAAHKGTHKTHTQTGVNTRYQVLAIPCQVVTFSICACDVLQYERADKLTSVCLWLRYHPAWLMLLLHLLRAGKPRKH